jgi:putative ABC transport system permease protein
MNWLAKTHGRQFELVRFFLRRMFDGEWSSSPGQWKSGAIGAISLFLPAGLLLVREGALDPKYGSKYRLLEMAADQNAIHSAALADELALITLLLCVTGLIALLVWQSLFPSERDYTALASLPIRPSQVFTARFTSVVLFSAAIIAAMNILPSLIAPIEFGGQWRLDVSYVNQAGAQAAASGLACLFIFFAIVAIQGVLLNLVPRNLFTRVSVYAQGALAGIFLLGGFYSWSIKEWKPAVIAKLPEFGGWLPPVWFTGLYERLAGKGDPFQTSMSQRALLVTAIAITVAAASYLVSYRRYRKLLLEAPARLETPRVWRWSVLRLLARSPQQKAVMDFMTKTLVRSRTHRLLWLVYLGAAAAVTVNSSLVDGALFARSHSIDRALQFVVHFWPLACSVVVINGFRHVLSIPTELRANWIFQITESQGRAEWMTAVERFIIAYAIAPIYLALFPIAAFVLGPAMAIRLTILQLLASLGLFEALFYGWQKVPFTCSHIPGERPLVGVVARYLAILCAVVPIVSVMIAVAAQALFLFPIYLAILGGFWIWMRRLRREGWGEAKLLYEDNPSVVTDLGIKEITYAGNARLRRTAARYAGHADSEDTDSRADAWLRGSGVHPADLGGCTARGGGSALSGAAPAGVAGLAGGGLGSFGEQPTRQVLPDYGSRTQTARERGEPVAKTVGGNRADHGAGIAGAPFGEALTNSWLRLRTLFRRRQLDRDLEDEMQFHLAMREARLRESGVADASSAARRQFGNVALMKEGCRNLWTLGWIEAVWQDVRYAHRQMLRNRGFAAATTITLGLGIAATTAIYAVCDVLVWKPPFLHDPQRLVAVLESSPGNPHLWNLSSPADVEEIRRSQTVLDGLASWEYATADIVAPKGAALRVDEARVSPAFFDVVGVAPAKGRSFTAGEGEPGRDRVAILGDSLWHSQFQADTDIVGKTIRINDRDCTIVGVMPPRFVFPRKTGDLWTPLAFTPEQRNSRTAQRIDSVGRLKPGHTVRELQAELNGLAIRLENLYPQTNARRRFTAWPIQRYVVGDYAAQFAGMLFGAALFVLLIACVNIANLHIARGSARWREIAVRQAIGASRWRTVAQLVTESIVLALTGAALGVTLAWYGLGAIRAAMPPELRRYSPGWADLGIHPSALMFVLAVALLSGIVAGLTPALKSSRLNLAESLKEGGQAGTAGPGRHRLRSLLLVGEIALTAVLLVGAGLMVRGFHTLLGGKTAMEPPTVLALRLQISEGDQRRPDQVAEFYRLALQRIAALPGVQRVAAATSMPFGRHAQFSLFAVRDRLEQPGEQPTAQIQIVSPSYFETMRIPLRAGRFLDDRDAPQSTASAVISEELARKWWPGQPFPIGAQIRLGGKPEAGMWTTIVGVVGGIQASALDRAPRPTLYVPYTQSPSRGMDIAIRSVGNPMALVPSVKAAITSVDARQLVTDVMPLERMRENEVIGVTYAAALMTVFGGIALLLSCVGVYGMTAYLVSTRTHEIGIRMALGARATNVIRLVFRQGARAALVGMAVGLLAAIGFARLLASIIWGVNSTDPAVFLAVPLALGVAVGLAIYLPARKALRIDPVIALRNE